LRKYLKLVVTSSSLVLALAFGWSPNPHKLRQLTLIARQISRCSEFLEFRLNTFWGNMHESGIISSYIRISCT